MKAKFYRDRLCLNVLVNSLKNAKEIYDATEGHVLLGILSKNYDEEDAAVEDMRKYAYVTNNAISVGLGAGDPKQSGMVAKISGQLKPAHINQVFTGVGATKALLGDFETIINGLVSPCGKVGYVNISTGPESSGKTPAIVPIDAAIALLKDMGANSLKYFPMGGLGSKEEFTAVADSCAKNKFILEPTGGIDLNNFEEIVKIALETKVEKIIPHVYSSIIDKETRATRVSDVEKLYKCMKDLV